MKWEYGKEMLRHGDIESLDEWSDDKEYCCSIMDKRFDYLWDLGAKIHFIDRLYSDYKADPNHVSIDNTLEKRIADNEAELWFDNFDEVRQFIVNHRDKEER